MKKRELLSLKPEQLLTHPQNMRRFYPPNDVREMANSIAASNGVLEPLIVSWDGNEKKYVVIDGNMRLAGARLLSDQCPPLDCKLVSEKEADQLLTMVIANQVRYDIDPVSEGLHYKTLKQQGMSVRDISKRTGVYEIRISKRLLLADLDEPIQELIIEGKLPSDERVAKALLQLSPRVRVSLAKKVSKNPNMKIETIVNACDRLRNYRKPEKKLKRPAVELSGAFVEVGDASLINIRESAKKMCRVCNQFEKEKQKHHEPAWAMVVHEADKNCESCSLKDMQAVCSSCPAVTLLRNMLRRSVREK